MRSLRLARLAPGLLVVFGGCAAPARSIAVETPPPPPPTQIAQIAATPPLLSPKPPPPSPEEIVPPPPAGSRSATWQPGHWRWTGSAGNEWEWLGGHYVDRPPDRTAWVVGQWQSVPDGWVWIEGHWR